MQMEAAQGHPAAGEATTYPGGRQVGIPDPEGPGNAAWQQTLRMLERVQAEEDARRRRN